MPARVPESVFRCSLGTYFISGDLGPFGASRALRSRWPLLKQTDGICRLFKEVSLVGVVNSFELTELDVQLGRWFVDRGVCSTWPLDFVGLKIRKEGSFAFVLRESAGLRRGYVQLARRLGEEYKSRVRPQVPFFSSLPRSYLLLRSVVHCLHLPKTVPSISNPLPNSPSIRALTN